MLPKQDPEKIVREIRPACALGITCPTICTTSRVKMRLILRAQEPPPVQVADSPKSYATGRS